MDASTFNTRLQHYLFCGTIIASIAVVLLPILRTNINFVLPQLLLVTAISIAPVCLDKNLWSPTLRKFLSFSLGAALPLWITLLLSAEIWLVDTIAIIGTVIAAAVALWQLYSNHRAATIQQLAPVVISRTRQIQFIALRRVTINFFKSILVSKG